MTEILIPAPKPPEKKTRKFTIKLKSSAKDLGKKSARSAGKPLAWLFSRLAIFLLAVNGALLVGRIAVGYATIYPIGPEIAVSPEAERWQMSSYPIVRLVRFINQEIPTDAKILVFRQADIAYYTDNPIATYTDNQYSDLFFSETDSDLHKRLLDHEIEYVVLPAYGKAEVNNTQFATLLNNPVFSNLVFEAEGERVFSVRPASSPNAGNEDFDQSKAVLYGFEPETWISPNNLSLMQSLRFGPTERQENINEQGEPFVSISRDRPVVARRFLKDLMQPWELQNQFTPLVKGLSMLPVKNGIYTFEADIEAKGKVSLQARISTLNANGVERVYAWTLWDGVFDGDRKDIAMTTAVTIPELYYEEIRSNTAASLQAYFVLEQGGFLNLYDFEIDQREISSEAERQFEISEQLTLAYKSGWQLSKRKNHIGYMRPLDLFQMSNEGVLSVKQFTAAKELFDSPSFIVDPEWIDRETDASITRKSTQFEHRVTVDFSASGHGAIDARLKGFCANGDIIAKDLSARSLNKEARMIGYDVEVGCIPSRAYLEFGLDRDYFLSPPNFERAHLELSNLTMSYAFSRAGRRTGTVFTNPVIENEMVDVRSPDAVLPTLE